MGKNQKIPYLKEVLLYFGKVIILFSVLSYFINQTSVYNQPLFLIASIFFAFSFNPLYFLLIVLSYLISFLISTFNIGNIGLLFLLVFAVFLNTTIMVLYLKFKYKFTEEV